MASTGVANVKNGQASQNKILPALCREDYSPVASSVVDSFETVLVVVDYWQTLGYFLKSVIQQKWNLQ